MGRIAFGNELLENLNEIRSLMKGLLGSTEPEKVSEYEGLKTLYGLAHPEAGTWTPEDWGNWETKLKYMDRPIESRTVFPDAPDRFHQPGSNADPGDGKDELNEIVAQIWNRYPAQTPDDEAAVEQLYRLYSSGFPTRDPAQLRNNFFDQLRKEQKEFVRMKRLWPDSTEMDVAPHVAYHAYQRTPLVSEMQKARTDIIWNDEDIPF